MMHRHRDCRRLEINLALLIIIQDFFKTNTRIIKTFMLHQQCNAALTK